MRVPEVTKKKTLIEYSKIFTKNVERCMKMLNLVYDGDDEFPTIVTIQAREHQNDLEDLVKTIKTRLREIESQNDEVGHRVTKLRLHTLLLNTLKKLEGVS